MNKKNLAELYNEDIYLIREASEEKIIEVKGENRKDIVVLIDYPQANFLPGDLDELFQKIMSSVSLTYKDIALINIASNEFDEIPVSFTKILTFGVKAIPGFDIDMIKYQILKVDGIDILIADNLKDISDNKELKMQLWNSIRLLFSV